MGRDDFSKPVIEALARRTGVRCSNPDCRKLTSGPHSDPAKTINIGVAAHITAASEGGPRYDPTLSSEQRQSITNGIWLCQDCAKLIDSDEPRFSVALLAAWKSQAEEAAQAEVEGRTSPSHTVKEDLDRIRETQEAILDNQAKQPEDLRTSLAANAEAVQRQIASLSFANLSALLAPQHEASLQYARWLIEENRPAQALAYLESQKEVVWHHATDATKAQFLNCMGAAQLRLMREREAASLFFAAKQHDDQDEKILCNCAVAHLLLGDDVAALEAIKAVLGKNPASMRAHSVMIHASVNQSFEQILETVPPHCREHHEVAFALGSAAQERKKPDEAVKWFRVAVNEEEGASADAKASLATAILATVLQDEGGLLHIAPPSTTQAKSLREAIFLFDTALDVLQEPEIRRSRILYLVNRGVARKLFGDRLGSVEDLDEALQYEPNLPAALFHRAVVAESLGDKDLAIRFLDRIADPTDVPFAPLFKAELVFEKEGADAAIAEIDSFLATSPSEELVHTAKRLLIRAKLAKEDILGARKLSDEVLNANPTDVMDLVDAGDIRRRQGFVDEADALLAMAKRSITASTRPAHIVVLADAFYDLGQFAEAASTYESVADPAVDCPITRRFLRSCYSAGRMDRALEIAAALRSSNGPLQFASEVETVIYEDIGDLAKAEAACQSYLDVCPDDGVMRIRLAVIHLRNDNIEKVDSFLEAPPDCRELPAVCAIQVANLLAVRDRHREAIQLLYEVRRNHLDDGNVHLRYIQSILLGGHSEQEWMASEEVRDNSAVCIEDISHDRSWYIIDDRADADIGRNELRLSHPLAQRLLGKKAGDTVPLKDGPVASEASIVEVKSKYLHAFHESAGLLEVKFPDVKGFFAFQFPKGEEGARLAVEAILDQVTKSHDARQTALKLYLTGKTTLGHLSNLIGVNIVDTWTGLTADPRGSVRCCLGTEEERADAIAALGEGSPQLVVDIVSLLTLHEIGAADKIVAAFGKLGVAQTTIDELNDTLHKRRLINPDGYETIARESDHFTRRTVTAESVQQSINDLGALVRWVREKCVVLPVTDALRSEREHLRERGRLLGEENVDTVLISKEPGRLLLSDDVLLRAVARAELDVRGVWTQAILLHALHERGLPRSAYDAATLALIKLGYRLITVDSGVLLHAASEAKWLPDEPFESVVQRLGHDECGDESAVAVAVNFLYELSQQQVTTFRQDALLFRTLDVLVSGRRTLRILRLLVNGMRQRFLLFPFAADDYLAAIRAWQSRRLASV